MHTSDEIVPFLNHALYNYFDTNCWELLSETAKAMGKPLSNDRLCHYGRKLNASYYSESYVIVPVAFASFVSGP